VGAAFMVLVSSVSAVDTSLGRLHRTPTGTNPPTLDGGFPDTPLPPISAHVGATDQRTSTSAWSFRPMR
jgi:hypothetical protein